jgi:hypothetical protein
VRVEASDPTLRAAAVTHLAARLRRLDPGLVERVVDDDGAARAFAWKNRLLFASLDDVKAARDASRMRIRRATLTAPS